MSHVTPVDAESYRETFDIQQVIDRLDDHQDGYLNAYHACCGRHLRQGRGDVLALVHEDTAGQVSRLTYRELDQQSARLAGWMAARGLGVGDRIACMLPRSPQLLVAVVATWRLGAVYQPLFTAFGPDAVDYRLGRADTRLVITDAANRHKFDGLESCPPVLALGGASETYPQDLSWDEALTSEAAPGIAAAAAAGRPLSADVHLRHRRQAQGGRSAAVRHAGLCVVHGTRRGPAGRRPLLEHG